MNLCFVVAVVVVRLNGCGAAACMHDNDGQQTRSLCMAKQQVALTRMALDSARPKYFRHKRFYKIPPGPGNVTEYLLSHTLARPPPTPRAPGSPF